MFLLPVLPLCAHFAQAAYSCMLVTLRIMLLAGKMFLLQNYSACFVEDLNITVTFLACSYFEML